MLRFVNLVSTLSRLDPALAMYIVKYEELRYVVAEHTADESLRLVLVDTERTGHTYQRRSLHASHLCKTTKKVPPAALPPPTALCASASPSPLRSRPATLLSRNPDGVKRRDTLVFLFGGFFVFLHKRVVPGSSWGSRDRRIQKNLFKTQT